MDLSIVVPFYKNTEDVYTVLNTVAAFIGSSEQNIEVVLINDSADGSKIRVDVNYPFSVGIIELDTNIGVTAARNIGYRRASGEYVLFFDSDDYLIKNMLDTVLEFLHTHQANVVFFRCVDEHDRIVGNPTLKVAWAKSPNLFYGQGECIVCVRSRDTDPFIDHFRGSEHTGLLKFALINQPKSFCWADFAIRKYMPNPKGLSSRINTKERTLLIAEGHMQSSWFSLRLGELWWAFRFAITSVYRFVLYLKMRMAA